MARRGIAVWALLVAASCSGGADAKAPRGGDSAGAEVGPFGPPLGGLARVVRSAELKTSGAVAGEFRGSKGDDETGLRGQCNPKMWANFGIDLPPGEYARLQVTLTSRDAIASGATGRFRLDQLVVEFTTKEWKSQRFRGRGVLELTTHDAAPGKRRMVGTMSGQGLEGRDAVAGRKLDATLAFDMDFSCGVLG
jgi:hypothetical protein